MLMSKNGDGDITCDNGFQLTCSERAMSALEIDTDVRDALAPEVLEQCKPISGVVFLWPSSY